MIKKKCLILVQILLSIIAVPCIYAGNKGSGDGTINNFELILPNLYRYRDACNSYLIKSGSSSILIDAGSETITEHLNEIGVRKIDWILHTHFHRDQCLGDLKHKQKGASIAIGSDEKDMLGTNGLIPPFKFPTNFLLNGELPDWGIRMAPFIKPGVDKILSDGDSIQWKQYTIHILKTPGHTKGSISYTIEMDGKQICFSGDLILKGGFVHDLYSMQWNYLENPGIDSSLVSLIKVGQFKPDLLLPSHGKIIDHPAEDIKLLTVRLRKVQQSLQFERTGRWNWSGFVQASPHVVQDCGTTSQFIIAPDGETMMFDCGPDFTPERLEIAKKMFGIRHIAVIIPSHWHYDHVNGISVIAKSEGAKIWVWEKLAEHLEFPETFPTTCWTGKSIKTDRILKEGEEFNWGGYEFRVYPNSVHMEEQMALSALVDGLKFLFIGDGSGSDRNNHLRSVIHGYNGISLEKGFIETAKSFYDADPYICVPAHSNAFAVLDGTRDEFIKWAAETTDAVKSVLPPSNPELGFDPYWASFYPARVKLNAGENTSMSLRIKNYTNRNIVGSFHLKSIGDLEFDNAEQKFDLLPGETKDLKFHVKTKMSDLPGIYIVTADIVYNDELFAEFPQGYLEVEKK